MRTAVVLALFAMTLIACSGSDLPADTSRLGTIRSATAGEESGAISEAAAMRAATEAGYDYPNRSAYLVVVTPNAPGSSVDINDRLVWLIRSEGIEIQAPATPGASRTEPFHFAYVLIDAHTGEHLLTSYGV